MFHVKRKSQVRGTELLRALGEQLGDTLPSAWSITWKPEVGAPGGRADAVFALAAPDGTTGKVLVEAKRVVEPRDVPSVLRQM